MVQHDQTVRLRHGAEHARSLIADGAHLPAAIGQGSQQATLIFGAAGFFAQGLRADGAQHRLRLRAGAHAVQQGRADESIERHHHRHRIARQAEQPGAVRTRAQLAESQRTARPHGDAPEHHFAHIRQGAAQVVGLTHAHAARGDDHIGAFGRGAQRGFHCLRIVGHHAEVDDFAAQTFQHAPQGVAIAVVHAAGIERLADRAQLVSAGEEGHAQLAAHRDFGHAQRGHQAQIGRAQQLACGQGRLAARQVFASQAAVVAGPHQAGRENDLIAFDAAKLLRHHGVAARGHHRAGHDAHGAARGRFAAEGMTGEPASGDRKHGVALRCEIGAAQGVAVHRRVVVGGHVDGRNDVLRQHPAECRAHRQALVGLYRLHAGLNDRQRRVHPKGVGVIAADAGDDVLQIE